MKRRYSLPLQLNGEREKDEFVTFRKIQEVVSNTVIL